MKLTEALGILKKNGAIISEANKVDAGYDHRGWARYGFNSPNKNRGYVKMLNFLYHAENGMTKKMIHNWLGLSTAPGNHSATWTEMSDAGLAKYDKHEQVWNITAKGRKYLEDNDLVIPLEDLTDPNNEAAGDSDSAKYLRKEIVKMLSNASGLAEGGLTRQQIARALDVEVAEITSSIRACMEAGEIEWDDDAGVFKAVEANAENLKKEFLEVLKRKHTLTYEEAAEELGVSIKQAVAAGNEWIKDGVVDWSPNNQVFFIPKNDKKLSGDDDDMYDDTPIVKQRDESFIGFLKQHGYCLVEAKAMNLEDWMYHVENVIYDRDYDPGMIEDIRAWAKEWYGKLVIAGCTTKEIDAAFFATENSEYDAPLKLLRSKKRLR